MKVNIIVFAALLAASCDTARQDDASSAQVAGATRYLPPGSNQMLRAPLTIADGLEVIISDVVIPPNATVPRHYHPGEEFLYVIEGSAVHVEEGKDDRILSAGGRLCDPAPGHTRAARWSRWRTRYCFPCSRGRCRRADFGCGVAPNLTPGDHPQRGHRGGM